jgi:hypothetical protein
MSLIPLSFWKTKYQFLSPSDYPTYGWSFWKRNPNYTGSCIRVRRNSDNTEQDIGFGSDNFLNVSAMLSFVGGSGNGFLVTFYDQFGSINLTNWTNSGNQFRPILVSSGQPITFLNGQPCIQFVNFSSMIGGSGTTMVTQFTSTLYWNEENSITSNQAIFGNNNNNTRFAIRQLSLQNSTTVFYDWGIESNYWFNESKEIENGPLSDGAYAQDLYDSISYRTNQQGARLIATRGIGYNSLGTGFSYGGRWDNDSGAYIGKSNEVLIYNNTTHTETKLQQIQSILNASNNFYNTTSVSNNLILWYDAGNSASYPGSGTTITDLSVGGAVGTLTNGVIYSSADGGKWVLDGVNDWINTIGTNGNYPWKVGGGDYTIECWVKFSNANQSARIFGTRNSSSGSMISLMGGSIDVNGNIISSRKISIAITNGNATRSIWQHTTNDIIDGNWKHIIATRTSKTLKIYINGVDQTLTTVNNVGINHIYVDTATSWRVADGGSGTGGNGAFEISIMRLYKSCLSQVQITRNYNLEKSRYGQ